MTVSFGIPISAKGNNFVFICSVARTTDEIGERCRKVRTWYGSFLSHLERGQKIKKLKSFYGCNIQVSVHLSL